MVIGEAFSDETVQQVVKAIQEHLNGIQNGDLVAYQVLVEEGGAMIVLTTTWKDREACLRYHASRQYRRLVEQTGHLLVGDFVVKLFKAVDVVEPRTIRLESDEDVELIVNALEIINPDSEEAQERAHQLEGLFRGMLEGKHA